jgi:DNA-binding CsgD family transcriptional regulator
LLDAPDQNALTLPQVRAVRLPACVLTKRELEIAGLVGDGMTNREIAEKLFLSKRTVDAHLEHIFGKLDISSRMQLIAWLRGQLS